jgi:citrate lyase subunit beta / citryl-CoA lyase
MTVRPWGVVLPKCESMAAVARLSASTRSRHGRERRPEAPGSWTLTVATETAAATLRLGAAESDPSGRLWGMLWGGEDLSATFGAQTNRDDHGAYTFPYQFARTRCLYAANASGVVAVDWVYVGFHHPRLGLRDGFSAKAAIHPAQVEVINEVLTPTPDQLDWAKHVVALLEDRAVARIDGKMVDLAHKRIAERLLTCAAAFNRCVPPPDPETPVAIMRPAGACS